MNAEHIKREFDAYRRDVAAARSILENYSDRNEELSSNDQMRFDALMAGAERHKKIADQLTEMHESGKEFRQLERQVFGDQLADSTDGDGRRRDEIRDMFDNNERVREFDLVRGFTESRAIANFSDSGALYTTDFATSVAVYLRTESPWMNLASVVTADNGRPMNVPTITADPTTVTPGEGTAITENSGTIGSAAITTTAYKTLSLLSMESYEDVEYDISDFLARSAARSIALKFGTAATTAVLAAINNGGTASGVGGDGTAVVSFVGYEDLLDLKFSRAAPYRAHASWIMSNGLIKKVRKFKDAQKQYYWQPAVAAGQPATFDGDPVWEDPNLATPASATKSVVYGDHRQALIIKATKLRVAVSGDYKFSEDQIALKCVMRAGIAVQDANGDAFLVSANT